MARKPSGPVELVDDAPINAVAILNSQNQVALLNDEQEARVRAVAVQLGYLLPADCSNPDLIQRDIASNMRRSVEACLEVGRGLQVLKVACAHGEFIDRLDALGLDRKVAVKFMTSAARFASLGGDSALTRAINGQSKLFEMLVLDDEQIEELELTGATGELSLDDVATMSVKELRKALRETREDKKAQGRLMADKDATLNELKAALSREPTVRPLDDELERLRLITTTKAHTAEAAIAGALHPAVHQLIEYATENGVDQRAIVAGLLAQVERAVQEIRIEYGIEATPTASAVPSWMREGADEEVAAALAAAQGA